MSTYRTNECLLDVPGDWHDRSIHVFTVGDGPPFQMTVVINKDEMKEGDNLAEFADQRLDQMESQLKQFTLIEKRQSELGGRPALEAEFKWRSDQGTMHQRQLFVPSDSSVILITVTAPFEIRPPQREQVDGVLASLRFE